MVYLRRSTIALLILVFIIIPWSDPDISLEHVLQSPSWSHPFGFDSLGRNLFQLTLVSTRNSLFFAFSLTALQFVLGILLAGLMIMLPLRLQDAALRALDAFILLPDLLIALLWSFYFGGGLFGMTLALLLGRLPGWIRFTYFQFRTTRMLPSFEAGVSLGGGSLHLIRLHLLRPSLPILASQLPYQFFGIILGEASLSFLGLGFPANGASLGLLFHSAVEHLVEAPYMLLGPACVLCTLSAVSLQILRYTQTK